MSVFREGSEIMWHGLIAFGLALGIGGIALCAMDWWDSCKVNRRKQKRIQAIRAYYKVVERGTNTLPLEF